MYNKHLESELEFIESETEQARCKETQLVKSLEQLDMGIQSMQEDPEMLRRVEMMQWSRQEQLLENQSKLEELFEKGKDIRQQLQAYEKEIIKEKKYLDDLSILGEDVSEAYSILAARSERVDAMIEKMNNIFYVLEKSSDSYILKDMGQIFGENITSDESYLDNFSKNQLMGMKRTIRTNFTEVSGDRKNVRNYHKNTIKI